MLDVDPNTHYDRDTVPLTDYRSESITPDERHNLPIESKRWSREQALKVVKSDFQRAAGWRMTNIEPNWMEAMDTYLATQPGSAYWKGTRTPRANLQSYQAFQQINALRPQVLDALTGSDLDFDVVPETPGVNVTRVHEVRSLSTYNLDSLGGQVKFATFRSLLDKVSEDGMVLGNGVFQFGWDGPRQVQTAKWTVQAEIVHTPHPIVPQLLIPKQTGRMVTQQIPTTQTISRFFAEPVEQVDFYIDPLTRSPNVQAAEFCVRRKMMTLSALADMRGQEGFDIPSDLDLYKLSRHKVGTEGDTTRDFMLSAQGVNAATNNSESSIDPRAARLELLMYYRKDRVVWTLGRRHVMFNGPNPDFCLPFFNWCYINKPGAFYGFSIPELLRGDQALIRTLMNGRVDELALILHPPFASRVGTFRSASQSKFGPGENMEVQGDPTKDFVRIEMGNITQNAAEEISAAEIRGQKKTGVNDISTGNPTNGGNSANRTAAGVQAQTNATSGRVHGLVATIEDTMVGHMLDQQWEMTKRYLSPELAAGILGVDVQTAVETLNSAPRFRMKTANNMKMRAAMQNGGLQQLTQYVLNPEILSLFGEQQGMVLDIGQFTEFALDVYGVKSTLFFRPMSPQEQQAKQQRDSQAGQEKLALQSARLQSMSADAHERDETMLIDTILGGILPAIAKAGGFNGIAGLPADIMLQAKELAAKIEGGHFDKPQLGAGT